MLSTFKQYTCLNFLSRDFVLFSACCLSYMVSMESSFVPVRQLCRIREGERRVFVEEDREILEGACILSVFPQAQVRENPVSLEERANFQGFLEKGNGVFYNQSPVEE